jgi:hypothetical protein
VRTIPEILPLRFSTVGQATKAMLRANRDSRRVRKGASTRSEQSAHAGIHFQTPQVTGEIFSFYEDARSLLLFLPFNLASRDIPVLTVCCVPESTSSAQRSQSVRVEGVLGNHFSVRLMPVKACPLYTTPSCVAIKSPGSQICLLLFFSTQAAIRYVPGVSFALF